MVETMPHWYKSCSVDVTWHPSCTTMSSRVDFPPFLLNNVPVCRFKHSQNNKPCLRVSFFKDKKRKVVSPAHRSNDTSFSKLHPCEDLDQQKTRWPGVFVLPPCSSSSCRSTSRSKWSLRLWPSKAFVPRASVTIDCNILLWASHA